MEVELDTVAAGGQSKDLGKKPVRRRTNPGPADRQSGQAVTVGLGSLFPEVVLPGHLTDDRLLLCAGSELCVPPNRDNKKQGL